MLKLRRRNNCWVDGEHGLMTNMKWSVPIHHHRIGDYGPNPKVKCSDSKLMPRSRVPVGETTKPMWFDLQLRRNKHYWPCAAERGLVTIEECWGKSSTIFRAAHGIESTSNLSMNHISHYCVLNWLFVLLPWWSCQHIVNIVMIVVQHDQTISRSFTSNAGNWPPKQQSRWYKRGLSARPDSVSSVVLIQTRNWSESRRGTTARFRVREHCTRLDGGVKLSSLVVPPQTWWMSWFASWQGAQTGEPFFSWRGSFRWGDHRNCSIWSYFSLNHVSS